MLDLAHLRPESGADPVLVLSEDLGPGRIGVDDDQVPVLDPTDEFSACHIGAATSGMFRKWHQTND